MACIGHINVKSRGKHKKVSKGSYCKLLDDRRKELADLDTSRFVSDYLNRPKKYTLIIAGD